MMRFYSSISFLINSDKNNIYHSSDLISNDHQPNDRAPLILTLFSFVKQIS